MNGADCSILHLFVSSQRAKKYNKKIHPQGIFFDKNKLSGIKKRSIVMLLINRTCYFNESLYSVGVTPSYFLNSFEK